MFGPVTIIEETMYFFQINLLQTLNKFLKLIWLDSTGVLYTYLFIILPFSFKLKFKCKLQQSVDQPVRYVHF